MTHNAKLEAANVVAAFDNQDDADEAVLGLRLAGFRDDQFGFLARNIRGVVTDYVGRTYTLAGTVIGIIVGAALGVWAARNVMNGIATPLGPALFPGEMGIYITNIVGGALLVAMVGAMCGWGVWRSEAAHVGSEVDTGGFVIAVNAGDRKDAAWAVIRRHGGYNPANPDEAAGHMGAGLPA
jgi:hypothetical protein